jgi:ketosteroid isomerase-like protein
VSSANLDLVRSICADWERGDYSATDWAHPEIEFVLTGGGPEDDSWRGLAGMAEGFGNYLSAWEDLRIQAEEYRELDDDRVLMLPRYSGRGKPSGLELGQTSGRAAILFHLRDGAVTRLVLYAERDRALADLGLAPEADSR